ncbi:MULTISPECIES: TolC family outer membrane protein [Desulfovibrio]|uniref:Outer membrane protein, adhesin transport system n=2 Tax=Desulfovibrio TaxID=872 RepID=A0AA94HSJ3_DESDE|nr:MULTISPECIES: TolC family outer membrane protein [Desulfovibrio]ATD81868.1 type I secretion protein TolC [Desulfovibrio sp. G11]MDY0204472.1 TolC family outer membrane protein [Desulfovibrio desulfuricans]SFW44916.1 outer membrane protein, adhesin transport system [Desulfovibrio desulfuricans]SPD34604.1 Potentially RTX toxin operon, subunit D [Desulfovibrio sp. G11]
MKQYVFTLLGLILLAPALTVAAESAYPPPPPAGQAITVEDSIYGVLRTNRALRGIQENRNVLEHEVDRAKAGFGPRVDVTGRAGGSVLSDSSTRNKDLDYQMWGLAGVNAQLVQPIWDGFATRSRVRTAKSTLESVKYRVFDTATSLSLEGIISHIDVLRRRKILELAEMNVSQHKALVNQAQDRASLGADTAADVTQARSRLQRALSSLSEAKAALLVAEDRYVRLTGLPAAAKMAPVTMPPELYKGPDAVLTQAEQSNPKLSAYMQDIRAARGERELADSAFYPTLNLEAGPNYTDRGGATDRWIYSFDVLGVVRWNIFNSGADLAERRAASARIRQSRQVMYDFLDELKLDIESTWTNYQAAQEQYSHYSKAVEYSKYTRSAYVEQFQIGRRSILDVLDTENELFNSSTQAETARGNILVGAYRLSALSGNLLPQMSINTGPLGQEPPKDATDPREEFAPGWFE